MDNSRFSALLDKNADFWRLPPTLGQTIFHVWFLAATVLIYTVALTLVLLCATTGGQVIADRIATDPVFSDDAWIVPVVNFSVTLIYISMNALGALFCISYPLAVGTHVQRLRQHTPPKNEV